MKTTPIPDCESPVKYTDPNSPTKGAQNTLLVIYHK